MFTQSSQFRAATYQPGFTRNPHSIEELAERMKQNLGENPRPFKTWLRIAENARRDAKTFQEQGDLDSAFVEYAKAATIVLEKIPAHPDYRVLLSTTQRHNMGLNGQEIVDNLAELKSPIMTRYEQWRANPSSMQSRAQASNPISQPLVAHHSIIKSVTNASPSVPVPVSISPPESANCPPDSGLPVAASALELVEGSLSRYRHSKAGHDGETEEEEVAHAARTAGGHDEPIPEPETPKQRFSALHPTKIPAQRRNMSHKSTIPSVNHSDGLALPTDTLMQSEASANSTPEVSEGFDMLHHPGQQPEYLRILRDKFGTPRPDRGQRYSFTDNSTRNEGDGEYQESFVDPDNESCNSGKTVSKGSLFTPSILSPARSQLTSILDHTPL